MLDRYDVRPALEHLWQLLADQVIGEIELGPFGWLWLGRPAPNLDNLLLRPVPARPEVIELVNPTAQRWIEATELFIAPARVLSPLGVITGGTAVSATGPVLGLECWSRRLDIRTSITAPLHGSPVSGLGERAYSTAGRPPHWVQLVLQPHCPFTDRSQP
ncbi:hypothetical protein [Actinomadura hibisca]|uniref:hypothetical protein n=1 Tax=Actinomadura hibisca TaxID=68565 RepID=UPI000836103B|nr:hypothetical protein [Actinomadura hibisca]